MSAYGVSFLVVIGLSLFAWTFMVENLRNVQNSARLPLVLAAAVLILATYLYAQMLGTYGPQTRGWAMIIFLTSTFHIGALALGGLLWAVLGPNLARRFLDRPLVPLAVALLSALACLFLSSTYSPPLA